MSEDQRGRRAGAEARRAGASFSPPDLDRTIRRRRRGRVVAAVSGTAIAVVAAVGVGALFMRTETNDFPADTTTTTAPDPTVTTLATTTTSPATTTTQAALPTAPIYGGVVRVASNTDLEFGYTDVDDTYVAPTINPLLDSWNASDVARMVVPGAFRIHARTGQFMPWVLAQIPSTDNGGVVSGDRVKVTYEIRPEAAWADGMPITAADFVFTHELIMRDDLRIDAGLRDIHSLIDTDSISGSDKTLTFTLTAADARYEMLFEWIVPSHAVDPATFADDWNDRLWLSGGPFVFDRFEPTASTESQPGTIYLSRNDRYWETDADGNALPYLDGIELQVFALGPISETTLATWFSTETTDLMLRGLISNHFVGSLGDPEERGFELLRSWDRLFEVVSFQFADTRFAFNPDSLNDQLLYRQAVFSAIDRQAIADELGAPVVSAVLDIAFPGLGTETWSQYEDPEQVPTLLKALGEQLGRDFAAAPPTAIYGSSYADTTILIGQNVAAQLNDAGIQATTDFETDFFGSQLNEGFSDVLAFRIFADPKLSTLLQTFAIFDPALPEEDRLFDWSDVGEPARRYTEIIVEAAGTMDRDQLLRLLQEAEQILADNAIMYPLVLRQSRLNPYWPDRIQGFDPEYLQGWDTANAAHWWSPEA